MSANGAALQARGLSKHYRRGSEEIAAVSDVTLRILKGEFVAITGPSGSGKTTLVHLLGCLDNPTAGELSLGDRPVFGGEGKRLSERRLTQIRRETFGYIFQNFYLLPTLSVFENLVLPLTFHRKQGARKDPMGLLKQLGLDHRRDHLPGMLSGGEMQRVAIARALVNAPDILLADEPTGNLDSKRSAEIVGILKSLSREAGVTVIMVTHNLELASEADRRFEMRDGMVL